jgi:hypothetical protein
MSENMSPRKWRFFRAGGFDQVSIETGADLLALKDLDQKLWVALSCPVKNLEFDTKTLDLVDSDHDGHIRAPEIIQAVTWACSVLKDPEILINGQDGVPLSAFNDETEEGKRLLASARHVLENLGKSGAHTITVEDTDSEEKIFAQMRFNGDGIVPAEAAEEPAVKSLISDIIDCVGPETDRGGSPGVSQEKVDQFFAEASSLSEWQKKIEDDPSILALGDCTEGAFAVINTLRDKVNDYFTRCKLAAYDDRSASLLNPSDADYQKLALVDLSTSTEPYAPFPLAQIAPDRPLPLVAGINPAWVQPIGRLREEVVKPLMGDKTVITAQEWDALNAHFGAYDAWCTEKPATSVEKLGTTRIREILQGGYKPIIDDLIGKDKSFEPEATAISSVDKLVRYCKNLHTLTNNFVAFRDFYRRSSKALFQAGTLYLDGRSCELCVRVEDVAAHVVLASLSRVYLVYCNCTRVGGNEKMTIAAAFTAGDSDQLIVGRNGVFYDRLGRDWDATVVRIIEHPISVRQAFWSPYKQASRLVSEQLLKMATARSKAAEEKMAAAAIQAGSKVQAAKAPVAKAFDAGKFAGIFAAIGLAIGAIGTAVASLITGLLRLAWWQLPLAIICLLLIISGPSMLIAWFKLRQRNLGPILDANGWAVNARAKINIRFGTTLTALAKLPEGSESSKVDPYADKERPWKLYLVIALLAVAFLVLWGYGYLGAWLRLIKR